MSSWEEVAPNIAWAVLVELSIEVGALLSAFCGNDENSKAVVKKFVADAKEKYERGNAEHNDAWEDWPEERFMQEFRDEILDATIYLAMMISKRDKEQDA